MDHDNDDEEPFLKTYGCHDPLSHSTPGVLLACNSTFHPALIPLVEQNTTSIRPLPARQAFSLASTAASATDVQTSTRTCLPIHSHTHSQRKETQASSQTDMVQSLFVLVRIIASCPYNLTPQS